MTKRLRNEEEERESPLYWPEAKKQTRYDDVGEDILAWLLVDEAAAADGATGDEFFCDGGGADELAELLSGDAGGAAAAMKVRFTETPHRSAAAMAAGGVFQTAASSYVTINGNEETCGSSFSDWDSSVMASVDIGGLAGAEPKPLAADLGGACVARADVDGACGVVGGEGGVDCGFDWDGDEESLARFMDEVFSEQSSLA